MVVNLYRFRLRFCIFMFFASLFIISCDEQGVVNYQVQKGIISSKDNGISSERSEQSLNPSGLGSSFDKSKVKGGNDAPNMSSEIGLDLMKDKVDNNSIKSNNERHDSTVRQRDKGKFFLNLKYVLPSGWREDESLRSKSINKDAMYFSIDSSEGGATCSVFAIKDDDKDTAINRGVNSNKSNATDAGDISTREQKLLKKDGAKNRNTSKNKIAYNVNLFRMDVGLEKLDEMIILTNLQLSTTGKNNFFYTVVKSGKEEKRSYLLSFFNIKEALYVVKLKDSYKSVLNHEVAFLDFCNSLSFY